MGSALHEGVDVRLVEKPWAPTVMELCEVNEFYGFENYADLIFAYYTPYTTVVRVPDSSLPPATG